MIIYRVRAMLIFEDPTVILKCRTAIKAMCLYLNLCPSVNWIVSQFIYIPCISFLNPFHAELYTQDITCMLNCFEEISQNLAFFCFCSVVKILVHITSNKDLYSILQSFLQYLQEMMLVEYTLNFKTLETHFIMVAMVTYFFT